MAALIADQPSRSFEASLYVVSPDALVPIEDVGSGVPGARENSP